VYSSFIKRQMWHGNLFHTHDHAAFTRPRAPENFQLQLAGHTTPSPPFRVASDRQPLLFSVFFSHFFWGQTDPAIYDPFKSA